MTIVSCDLCGGRDYGVRACLIDLGRYHLDSAGAVHEAEHLDLCLACRRKLAAALDTVFTDLKQARGAGVGG